MSTPWRPVFSLASNSRSGPEFEEFSHQLERSYFVVLQKRIFDGSQLSRSLIRDVQRGTAHAF
jgi:hypothetical protein